MSEQIARKDTVESKDEIRHYIALPRGLAALVAVAVFGLSVAMGAGVSKSQIADVREQLNDERQERRVLDGELKDINHRLSRIEAQLEFIIRERLD